MDYNQLASKENVEKIIASLKANGMDAVFVQSGQEAKQKVLEILPLGAEVMNMASVTLETLGLDKEIMESGKYDAVKNKLNKMDRKTQSLQMQKIGGAPEWAVGSVHAVTEAGQVIIASNTGSQLPAYAYAAAHIIWVVGTQKIVKDLDVGFKRIYDYILPQESVRIRKAYNLPDSFNSNVSKVLIINKEISSGRITMILVNEVLGF